MYCELQALFNYFSCSAVAIATLVGGSNATMVTALMIAAHMVSTLFLCPLFLFWLSHVQLPWDASQLASCQSAQYLLYASVDVIIQQHVSHLVDA